MGFFLASRRAREHFDIVAMEAEGEFRRLFVLGHPLGDGLEVAGIEKVELHADLVGGKLFSVFGGIRNLLRLRGNLQHLV